jgi:imidazole glycerol phosphate synthase subunit HisF
VRRARECAALVRDAMTVGHADAALRTGILHAAQRTVADLEQAMRDAGLPMREAA